MNDLQASKAETLNWFRDAIDKIRGTDVMTRGNREGRLRPIRQINAQMIGRMCMYYYDPKYKDVLPYYDRFPLVFPIGMEKGGFLGINVHYLNHQMRVIFLEQLLEVYRDKHLDEKYRLNTSYQMLQRTMNIPVYKPAVKRYLYSHIRSKIYVVAPEEWEMTLLLPTERFVKRDKRFVWSRSHQQVYS
jgi:hypothetical protein